MIHKSINTAAMYALIVALGLGAGYALPKAWAMVAPQYTSGDFKAFYPDARTKVVVYGTASCPYCAKARDYLAQRKVAFGDFDINATDKGKRDYTALGGKVVPLILIGDRRLDGYNEDEIDDALEELPAM